MTIKDREIIHTRLIDAPRELVWEAWTDPQQLAAWWGPSGFTNEIEAMDVRPGGVLRLVMVGPDGVRYPNEIRYHEVERPARLRWTHASGPGEDPNSFETEVTFEELGARTRVTLRAVFQSAAAREFVIRNHNAEEGGRQTLARLDERLADTRDDLVVTRTLPASRQRVWDAWTDRNNLGAWWGPKGYAIGVTRFDLRVGGVTLYWMEPPTQSPTRTWGRFVYREVTPIERLAWINSFSDPEGRLTRAPFAPTWPLELFNLLTLEDLEGSTRLTLRARPVRASPEDRATFAAMRPNVTKGFEGTIEQLAAWLAGAR